MGVPVSHTSYTPTHSAQSTCKREDPNDPKVISMKLCEGRGVNSCLWLKPPGLAELMSPPTVSLEGKDGKTTVEVGGGGTIGCSSGCKRS